MKLCEDDFLAFTPSVERQYYTGNIYFSVKAEFAYLLACTTPTDQQEPEQRSNGETGDDVQGDTSSPTIGLFAS